MYVNVCRLHYVSRHDHCSPLFDFETSNKSCVCCFWSRSISSCTLGVSGFLTLHYCNSDAWIKLSVCWTSVMNPSFRAQTDLTDFVFVHRRPTNSTPLWRSDSALLWARPIAKQMKCFLNDIRQRLRPKTMTSVWRHPTVATPLSWLPVRILVDSHFHFTRRVKPIALRIRLSSSDSTDQTTNRPCLRSVWVYKEVN